MQYSNIDRLSTVEHYLPLYSSGLDEEVASNGRTEWWSGELPKWILQRVVIYTGEKKQEPYKTA